MPQLNSRINANDPSFIQRAQAMSALLNEVGRLGELAATRSAGAGELFARRGQLLPRARLAALLDPGAPWLELSALAGYQPAQDDRPASTPGAGVICGIGVISGVRCVITANDSGIDAGAIQPMGREKILRANAIALDNRLPYVQLIESAGANLLAYRVEGFIHGGRLFYNLARLSAAGIPTVAVVHGSSTAGGAYLPGLSDHVIMVEGRAKAFLAGPPLLRAATGEIATDEDLGGARMHCEVSGLGEYLAQDDADAIRIAREVVANLNWPTVSAPSVPAAPPRFPVQELAGIAPSDFREPLDMREIIARIVDDSVFLETGADFGPQTLCGYARINHLPVGIITNNGPIDPAGANKATHFIQACCQTGTALLYLQNTTGYMVGTAFERGGMIKHGSKMIQAVANANVPSITLHCGASFGAGNYGMCGHAFGPRFVFSWPNASTAVMGGEQAAMTMRLVAEGGARRKGQPVDEAQMQALESRIVETFNRQSGAIHTSALMLDDGIIDPADTRTVLALVLQICAEADRRPLRPIQFGVARP